jgi:endonuclease YncB( thermonuclease family)
MAGVFEVKGENMKQNTIILGVIAGLCVLAGGAMAGHDVMTGKCVKVLDGDTLVIECDKARRTVEIDGIDAPELGQPWGKEVRTFVRSMVGGEKVEIEMLESDGNTVRARVFIDGVDLSEILVGRGLAWVPENGADSDLVELSAKARALPCGLWMDPEAQPPWEYRATRS